MNSFIIFLLFFVLGLLFGLIYDLFKIFRNLTRFKIFIFFIDILFFVLFSLSIFKACVILNSGNVRYFIIQASFLGIIFYKFIISKKLSKLEQKMIKFLKRVKNHFILFNFNKNKRKKTK